MVLVGKSQDNANTLLADIQAELEYNQRYINDFGKQKNAGNWTERQFVTQDDCAFFARGRGQSPRGLRYKDNGLDKTAFGRREPWVVARFIYLEYLREAASRGGGLAQQRQCGVASGTRRRRTNTTMNSREMAAR